jgi:hypothetical protein
MRNLIVVAIVSAVVGAALMFWAKSTVLATGAQPAPAGVSTGALISPHDFMKASKGLLVESFDAF